MTEPTSPKAILRLRGVISCKTSTAATIGLGLLSNAHAAGSDTIKVGLIGCGGRGTGAAENICEAAGTTYNIKLHAMGDVFPDHLKNCRERLRNNAQLQGEVRRHRRPLLRRVRRLSEGHRLLRPGDAGDPARASGPCTSRPTIKAGKHLFTEKPVAVDGTGIRKVLAAYEEAKKKGLSRRRRHPAPPPGRLPREHEADPRRRHRRPDHGPRLLEPGGHLGQHAPARLERHRVPDPQLVPLPLALRRPHRRAARPQPRRRHAGRWAPTRSGPSAWAAARCITEPERGQSYDHFAVDYEFPNGVHILSMARQIAGCANNVSETIVGTKGQWTQRRLSLHRRRPRIGSAIEHEVNPYVQEHIDLLESITVAQADQRAEAGRREHADGHHGPDVGLHRQGRHLGAGAELEARHLPQGAAGLGPDERSRRPQAGRDRADLIGVIRDVTSRVDRDAVPRDDDARLLVPRAMIRSSTHPTDLPFTRISIMRKRLAFALLPLLAAWSGSRRSPARAADTAKIVLIAGRPSHGPGDHEFNAGCKLLAKCLSEVPGVEPVVVTGGWPKDETVFDGARTLVFFMDGGGGHPMIQRRPPRDDPEADGQGRRPGLPALRRRGPQGEARRQVPRLDRRLLRDRLLDQSALDGRDHRACPSTRSPAASSRSPSATSGTSTSASAPR